MEIIFEADGTIGQGIAKVTTHPAETEHWGQIREAIHNSGHKLVVIHPKNDRNVQILLSSVAVIESEDRMSNVRVITGERYLLNKRLKGIEDSLESPHFVKINNTTIINTSYIKEFSSTDNARIKVVLTDGSSYLVSRFYIKNFRGKLS
ncbi:LytTR family DNA-binding domain-containing protein [Paenibacillus pedocola]|uniref:LytTR family DNA-binding domain-containing protein n=1 Tax=Paenibacillus pedocola TaxID=3242193 RepID=UPI00287744B7|nr:LytTR family DNA-binding domain-containing protein [Paenibacillus typhae]